MKKHNHHMRKFKKIKILKDIYRKNMNDHEKYIQKTI